MIVTTHFSELIRLAKAEAIAKKSGNKELIDKAIKEHEEYKEMCLAADKMIINLTRGDL